MKNNLQKHLLIQIDAPRGDISHEALSKQLGDFAERRLAHHIAGKGNLLENDFRRLAQAMLQATLASTTARRQGRIKQTGEALLVPTRNRMSGSGL